jgi:ABC-type polysaccharide/polyol phosphate export permease
MSNVKKFQKNHTVQLDFFIFSVLKELRPKYRIFLFGLLWTLGQPLLSSFVVTSIFRNKLSNFVIQQNYFFFCFAGLSIWTFFSNAINQAGSIFQNRVKLIKSSSNNRLLIALAPITALFLELLFSLYFALFVFELLSLLSFKPLMLIGVFLAALLVFIFTASSVLLISVISLEFRDLRYLIPFFVQLGFLTAPVIYEAPLEGFLGSLYHSSPLALSMRIYRWTLGLQTFPSPTQFMTGIVMALFWAFACGLFFHLKSKKLAEFL